MKQRITAVLLAFALLSGSAAACSGKKGNVSCNLNNCTVTLNRGVDASTSVLGVKVKLISVSGSNVTVSVGGNQVNLPIGSGDGTTVGSLNVRCSQVTADNVTLIVTKQ